MRYNGLDLNLLVALDALLTHRSVTRAATQLHLSQSAVSCALNRLRDNLQDEILIQEGRRMLLTSYAEQLTPQVRTLLLQIDATIKVKPEFRPETSERLFRIAASDYVAHVAINNLRRELLDVAPGINLELLPVNAQALNRLNQGELDLIIVPDRFISADHPSCALFDDSIVVLAWKHNTKVRKNLSLEHYLELEHVAFQPEGEPITFESWLMKNLQDRRIRISTLSYSMLPYFVVDSLLLATVPLRLAQIYTKILPVKIVTPKFDLLQYTETMQWHQTKDNDPGLKWLKEKLIEAVSDSATTS